MKIELILTCNLNGFLVTDTNLAKVRDNNNLIIISDNICFTGMLEMAVNSLTQAGSLKIAVCMRCQAITDMPVC